MTTYFSRRRTAALVAAGAVLTFLSGGAEAATACKPATGKVRLAPVSGPECLSPVGMCFAGELTGRLTGTAFTTATSITPTVDTPTTGVIMFTADSVITTREGTLSLKEAVLFQTTDEGDFSELSVVVGGTEGWEGASGVFRVDGTYDGTVVSGRYEARICTA